VPADASHARIKHVEQSRDDRTVDASATVETQSKWSTDLGAGPVREEKQGMVGSGEGCRGGDGLIS
jgi:hypothetical protein